MIGDTLFDCGESLDRYLADYKWSDEVARRVLELRERIREVQTWIDGSGAELLANLHPLKEPGPPPPAFVRWMQDNGQEGADKDTGAMAPGVSAAAPINWREVARELATALANIPPAEVWRDYLANDNRIAAYTFEFWSDHADEAGERWRVAEDAAARNEAVTSDPSSETGVQE